jgi:hypothetical protein
VAELVHHHADQVALADAVSDHVDEPAAVAGGHRQRSAPLALLGDRMAAVDARHHPAAGAANLGEHRGRRIVGQIAGAEFTKPFST